MSDTVEKIKDRLSILDVVQPYVKLTRAGKQYRGLSPFTKEKTPSFFVSPDRGLYHCFSTGKGGDMFTFIEEMEGVDFRGALKMLADKAGVELEPERTEDHGVRDRLYAALKGAEDFFSETLKSRADAVTYLKERGLTEETTRLWAVGYAPKEWQALKEYLAEKKFTDSELLDAGLVKRPESGEKPQETTTRMYDRFRCRLMFPIRDISGRTVGFSGRIFEDDPAHPQAKYLNSPETRIFDKSRVLYGLDKAREGIRELGAALLVEGQMDLLMAHQGGYRNAVATSGTSFTVPHAELLKRYTPNLLIAYDGDRAGVSAAGRAAAIALRAGMDVKIAKLPSGKDPADLLSEDKEAFRKSVREASHVVDFYLAHLADAKYDQRTFRLEVTRTVLPYVAEIVNRVDQAHFVNRVSEALGVPEDAVTAEVKKLKIPASAPSAPGRPLSAPDAEPFLSRIDFLERLVVGLLLLFKERGDLESLKGPEDALQGAVGDTRIAELSENEEFRRAALFRAELFLSEHGEGADQAAAVRETCLDFIREANRERYRETAAELRRAEAAHDEALIEKLTRKLNELAPSLEAR